METAEIEHIFPYSIPEYKRYEYRKTWLFRWMPASLFRFLEKRWGWHLCVTARMKAGTAASPGSDREERR